jgi:hypothetical protein
LSQIHNLNRQIRWDRVRGPSLGWRRIMPGGVADAFERVVVINLSRRSERFERFSRRLEGKWPFRPPRRFEAVDGLEIAPPAGWSHSPGAWGCLQSHRAVLDSAIADGIPSLLVMEDDAYPVEDFPELASHFLRAVPEDWDCLMLGAEHLLPPEAVVPGVVRCTASIRCHAYAVRGKIMPMLSAFWQVNRSDHCDLVLCSLMRSYKFYAADPLLIGQDEGMSDIQPTHYPVRFFTKRRGPT